MNATKQRSLARRKRFLLPLTILVLLLAFRLLLPFIVKNYINRVLADIPGYYGAVADVDIALIRGAYILNGLYLNKVDSGSRVPFLEIAKTDISIEWDALIRGKIVSEVVLTHPVIIYVFEDQQKKDVPEPEYEDWTQALTGIVPITINHLRVVDGKAAFVQLSADPNIDLNLDRINLYANNLANVVQQERSLPSDFYATAVSIGEGKVELKGKINLIKRIPDMDVALSLENASVTALNDFTKHYAGIDFEEGLFELYSELAIADGFLTGYFKPIIQDAKLIGKDDNFLATLWEGFVGFFKFILKNHKRDSLATKIPVEGDLNNVKSSVWPTVFNIFKNAWIQAFQSIVDNEIEFEDAEAGADERGQE